MCSERDDNLLVKEKHIANLLDISVENLLVLRGIVNGHEASVLKDDGCNTNIMSHEFLRKYRHLLEVRDANISISHSKKGADEEPKYVVVNAAVQIGAHVYTSNWAVAKARYDILLGMPWHVHHNPKVDYINRKVQVGDVVLPLANSRASSGVKVTNISISKFRSTLKNPKLREKASIFYAIPCNKGMEGAQGTINLQERRGKPLKEMGKERLFEILDKYDEVFRDELPDGLPIERAVDHRIETLPGCSVPNRPLFQLSPAELLATKEYVEKLLRSGKLRRSIYPYGAPLFLLSKKGN